MDKSCRQVKNDSAKKVREKELRRARKKARIPTQDYEVYFTERFEGRQRVEGPERLRHVRPYVHQHKTHAKGRWVGRSVLEVLSAEFFGYSPEFYSHALKSGRITVNDRLVGDDYVVKGGDSIAHHEHIHEPPVDGGAIHVIAMTDDELVVSKPGSVPVHPAGAYRFNSLPYILESMGPTASFSAASAAPDGRDAVELPGKNILASELHVTHRLDRLTSGVQILARTAASARRLSQDIKEGETEKVYLARVVGKFGTRFDERWQRGSLGGDDAHFEVGWAVEGPPAGEDGGAGIPPWIKVQQPIISLAGSAHDVGGKDPSMRVIECSPLARGSLASSEHCQPKAAATRFRLVSFDGSTSIVECRPMHGRTHQIRLHLQFLNHPIANDPSYGGVEPWHRPRRVTTSTDDNLPLFTLPREPGEEIGAYVRRTCKWCFHAPRVQGKSRAAAAEDAAVSRGTAETAERMELFQSCIWLHAWRYTCRNESTRRKWSYEAPLPAWAKFDDSQGAGGVTGD